MRWRSTLVAIGCLAGCAGQDRPRDPPGPAEGGQAPAAPGTVAPGPAPGAVETPQEEGPGREAALEAMVVAARGARSPPAPEPSRAPPPAPAGDPAPGPGPEPPGSPLPAASPSSAAPPSPAPAPAVPPAQGAPASPAEEARALIDRLRSRDRKLAGAALRELWEVDARLIPALILLVDDPTPSVLSELKILVLDKEGFARLRNLGTGPVNEHIVHEEPGVGKLVHDIQGMGSFEYEELSSGPALGGKGIRVVVRRSTLSLEEGPRYFPVGVVVRSALINRFRTAEKPPLDHRRDIVRWWQLLYELRKEKL